MMGASPLGMPWESCFRRGFSGTKVMFDSLVTVIRKFPSLKDNLTWQMNSY